LRIVESDSTPITRTLRYIPVRMNCTAVLKPNTKPEHAEFRS
jgi:hypothetical protein